MVHQGGGRETANWEEEWGDGRQTDLAAFASPFGQFIRMHGSVWPEEKREPTTQLLGGEHLAACRVLPEDGVNRKGGPSGG